MTQLNDLVGVHTLTGCDLNANHNYNSDSNSIAFTLDNITYIALEDPHDSYRSSMKDIEITHQPVSNIFEPVQVTGSMKDDFTLQLLDNITRLVILEVGTCYDDDYYPYFVATFDPQNMCLNLSNNL